MMVNNMFSMFDPSSSFMSLNWLIMATSTLMLKQKLMGMMVKMNLMSKSVMVFISKEINQMLEKKLKFSNQMFMLLFFTVLSMNTMAIFPYNFTPTAHVSISFTLSTTLWLATMMFGWKNHFNEMMVHLTPLGTPNSLMNFMVVIEMISAMIRPITLSIRLSANMVAGHLLMSLLSSFSMMSSTNFMLCTTPMTLLIMLEAGVALVQAYVLMTLMLLYQNETS